MIAIERLVVILIFMITVIDWCVAAAAASDIVYSFPSFFDLVFGVNS